MLLNKLFKFIYRSNALKKLANKKIKIVISQLENIGDVVITLPMAAILKEYFPNCEIIFIARSYTQAVVEAYDEVDRFIDWNHLAELPKKKLVLALAELNADIIIHVRRKALLIKAAKAAGIKIRIGKIEKFYNYFYYNQFIQYEPKQMSLHQSQFYLKLLEPLKIPVNLLLDDFIPYLKLTPKVALRSEIKNLLASDRFKLIIHPGSNGHSKEWPVQYFKELIQQLPQNQFQIFITGNARERNLYKESLLDVCPQAIDLMDQLTLAELLTFISLCNGIVSNSTGPLHLAAALDIHALGLFPGKKGMNPQRWQPLGKKAQYIAVKESCEIECSYHECECMQTLEVARVKSAVVSWLK